MQAPLQTLAVAMTVMCYLACLSIGALVLVSTSVGKWTSSIAGQITVQVRPIEGVDMEAEMIRAASLIGQTPGIESFEVLSRERSAELLEPWLGNSAFLADLPVPRLIAITVDPENPPDYASLEKTLRTEVKGAVVDTHRRWQNELAASAATLTWLGLAVLGLIALSAVALVVYATSNALEANRDVIEVLMLVGAHDRFIARLVERRFLIAGLRAGLIGLAGGIATFALISLTATLSTPSGLATASRELLFGPLETSLHSYLMMAMVPLLATLISLVTARSAVHRILRHTY